MLIVGNKVTPRPPNPSPPSAPFRRERRQLKSVYEKATPNNLMSTCFRGTHRVLLSSHMVAAGRWWDTGEGGMGRGRRKRERCGRKGDWEKRKDVHTSETVRKEVKRREKRRRIKGKDRVEKERCLHFIIEEECRTKIKKE